MTTVHTVLGPVPADDLGVVAVHEALLSVVPGAEHAFDLTIDRAEVFEILAKTLTDFRNHGGGTIVDATGMCHGRDLRLYEALSRATGVHIVASTGMGPEELLGGYFLTPQTNPPTPWPAERFADLFAKEVTKGMVIPRVERRATAGLITTAADPAGMTATEESLFRGAARAALATGVPLSVRYGYDAVHDLGIVLDEGLPAERVVVGGQDRRGAAVHEVARLGAFVALDHVGSTDTGHLTDAERTRLVRDLADAGFDDRILLSCSAVGVAKGHAERALPYERVLTGLPLPEDLARRVLVDNPRRLLTVRRSTPCPA